MNKEIQLDILKRKIEEADAIVVGGASGMSAASGFKFYYQDDAIFRQIAGSLREKYGFRNLFDGFYNPRMTKGEHWALMLRTIKYIYECETGETYTDLADLLRGKNYYIVTTNQDAQFYRTFPENRITRLQGDWRYFQCKGCCHDNIYNNKEMVMELYEKIEKDSLPNAEIPRCPMCGGEMDAWVRSREFLQGNFYQQELQRYMSFLQANTQNKTLFLELGVGMMTPMFIKEPFMNMVYQWPQAYYVSINPLHAIIPKEIKDKSLAINEDIAFALKVLLGKPADNLKSEKQSDIFNPSRIY